MKSFYNNLTFLHVCNSSTEFIEGCESTSVIYSGGLTDPKFDAINNIWIENAAAEEVLAKLEKDKVDYIKSKYELHKAKGWEAYQNFRAKIILDIESGLITMEQAFLIEHDLKIAYDRIAQNGDWKTAYYELSSVVPSQPFVQPYLTMALQYIGYYIQNNYDN